MKLSDLFIYFYLMEALGRIPTIYECDIDSVAQMDTELNPLYRRGLEFFGVDPRKD